MRAGHSRKKNALHGRHLARAVHLAQVWVQAAQNPT
jgi:hypothetical protein